MEKIIRTANGQIRQTIIVENGGSVKAGETLTNIGAVIGSLSEGSKLGIEVKKVVIRNLKRL